MPFEQHDRIVTDSARHLGLDAVACSDQHLGVLSQEDCQDIAAVLGDDRARRSNAVVVVANQLPFQKSGPGCHPIAGHDLDVDKRGPVDVFKQQVSSATRQACRRSLVMNHRIVPTLSTRKYPPLQRGSLVAKGDFVPYTRIMNIEAMQVEHDRITAYLREHALEKANKDPEFRKAHITHCILTELLMPGPLSPANLATAQKQLRQIEDGTHPDLLR